MISISEKVFFVCATAIGPPCRSARTCFPNNKFKSSATVVAVRSESKREENLKLRNSEDRTMMMTTTTTTKDEGYYSFEHNRRDCRRSKSDAATQTCFPEGLFKGSIGQLMDPGYRVTPAERPRTLHKLKNVYENVTFKESNNNHNTDNDNANFNGSDGNKTIGSGSDDDNRSSSTFATGDRSLSVLSPFDEQEEWAKISEIMASFSSDLIRDSIFVAEMEKEIQSRLGLGSQSKQDEKIVSKVGQWLQSFGLGRHESVLLENGYDDVDFLNGILDEDELKVLGVPDEDVRTLVDGLENLPDKIREVQKRFSTIASDRKATKVNGGCGVGDRNDESCEGDDKRPEGGDSDEDPENSLEIVDKWLDSIRLGIYKETFKMHSYLDFERIQRIWEIELFSVLDITKRGHRRRILASVNVPFKGDSVPGPNLEEITADLSQLKSNIKQLKEEIREKLPSPANNSQVAVSHPMATSNTLAVSSATTGTLRHSHKKNKPAPPPPTGTGGGGGGGTPAKMGPAPNLPIRNPSELLYGVPSTLTTKWRHRPEELVTGCINYVANYLGSTVVKELKGTESTKKSIQKLKKTSKELTMAPDIILAISYRGVKFLNTGTQELVCEHEIRNIHCACQDADDLTHFAYITKDHISRSHYCHVFCVETMDQATEVILTLGQAFEVAYQIILREQIPGNRRGNGHTRSQSANQIVANNVTQQQQQQQPSNNYSRSASIGEMKGNDQLSKANTDGGGTKMDECEKASIVISEDF